MIPNSSPWLAQLDRTRPSTPLSEDIGADLVIVGGGIAGASTAYFALKETQGTVALLEADMVAHGATGHNAGQVTSYFERPFESIVTEFGLEMASEGQRDIESAWGLLDEIIADAKLRTPLYRFTGYAGCSELPQLVEHLEENKDRVAAGLNPETILVAKESGWEEALPLFYQDLYSVVPQQDLLALLETDDARYMACIASAKGCMNSALFTEELMGYLIAAYPGRFSLYEETPVTKVTLGEGDAVLETRQGHRVEARRVVLCTNGFEQFHIENGSGSDIDTKFHHLVQGRIGYMAGYLESMNASPVAISYFPKGVPETGDPTGETYFYFTRRPHGEDDGGEAKNLVCAGGPEQVLPNQAVYSRADTCREDVRDALDGFLSSTYRHYPDPGTEYAFCWHGLMGYTPGGLRRIGMEPCNPVLLYNLGCNGVGILPSVYGGKRIARILGGEILERSIFDPVDQRVCI
jgi:glycine/D-amino acid oxidase-like deaminating enzyme